MSIRIKLMAALLALSTLGMGLAWLGAYRAAYRAATDKIEHDFDRTVEKFIGLVESQKNALEVRTEAVLRQKFFLEVMGKANDVDASLGLGSEGAESAGLKEAHDAIQSADLSLLKAEADGTPADLLVLVNRFGVVVFDARRPDQFGDDLKDAQLVSEVLVGTPGAHLLSGDELAKLPVPLLDPSHGHELYLVLTRPIPAGDYLAGAVITGMKVRSRLLPTLRRLMDADVALASADGAWLTTLPEATALPPGQGGGRRMIRLSGRRYFAESREVKLSPLDRGTQAILLKDFDREVGAFIDPFVNALPPIGVGVLLAAIALAGFVSRRMSKPLVELARAAVQVRLGQLVSVQPAGKDEVGRLAAAFNEMIAGLKQRDEIKGLFKRYLNPRVVDELIRHPEKASPGGERRPLTVLFCDLVGFTTWSERMSPEQLVALLNAYFQQAIPILSEYEGTLDKIIGDALMCFWNAPLPQADHALRACHTALDLLALVDRLAEEFARQGIPRFDCRIGINTGSCVVGNLGSSESQYYTAIGDPVNLASRLEGAAKIYGVRILASEQTVEQLGGSVAVRELDWLLVKGKAQPVRVFEIIGRTANGLSPVLDRYREGLSLYRKGDFASALRTLSENQVDPPSAVLGKRCLEYQRQPPGAGWDAIHRLDSK